MSEKDRKDWNEGTDFDSLADDHPDEDLGAQAEARRARRGTPGLSPLVRHRDPPLTCASARSRRIA